MSATVSVPTAVWLAGIVGLFVWMLFRPFDSRPWKVLALIAFLAAEPLSNAVMNAEKQAHSLKYDYLLQAIDQTVGPTAFSVARLLTDRQRGILFAIYESLTLAMVTWYLLQLVLKNGKPRQLLYAYLIAYFLGPALYLIVPACGPRHAFGAAFPFGQPSPELKLVMLNFWPNAMPSLHVATALLFALFSARNGMVRAVAWFYVIGTILATLAFEHYVIDLVVAVPYAWFAFSAAEGRIRAAFGYLGCVLIWLMLIRLETPMLIEHPTLLRIAVLLSVCPALYAMYVQCKVAVQDYRYSWKRRTMYTRDHPAVPGV
jgi:hypothetical protein